MMTNDLRLSDIEIKAIEAELCSRSLEEFVKRAWPVVEPHKLVWNWHMATICGYLEAVYHGQIKRLIINIPPGMSKSLIVSVFYPAWVWTKNPSHKFLATSNEGTLATRDSLKMRTLVESEWYQALWPKIKMSKEQYEKTLFANTLMGHRESQGFLAKVSGKRGDTILIDDPHDAKQTESEVQRKAVTEGWDIAWTTRLNDMNEGSIILIMQRLHVEDLTGHLLKDGGWTHLVIPMHYDPDHTYDASEIGRPELNDPRKEPGELLFPQRFSADTIQTLETKLGPYSSAGQLEQRPVPKGGGELKKDWICYYKSPPRTANYCILVDPAGERKTGRSGKKDNTAMGVIAIADDGNYYLIDAYRDIIGLVERTKILFKWHRQYRPLFVGYERYGMQSDIAHIEDIQERESYRFKVTELGGSLKKEDRIRQLIPDFAARRIWFPETLYRVNHAGQRVDLINSIVEDEYLSFPVAPFDDFLDMLARLKDPDFDMGSPIAKTRKPIRYTPHVIMDRSVGY